MTQRIVVGLDGSSPALAALSWAVAEARLRGDAELVAVSVEDPRTDGDEDVAGLTPDQVAHGYPIRLQHRHGNPADELTAASRDADLLVVGSRGRGGVPALLGSVSRRCVAHARCPVVVVRSRSVASTATSGVVVGVDASASSRRALRIAAEEARLGGVPLRVVHAVYWDPVGGELITPSREQLLAWGHKLVHDELAEAGVTARVVVRPGHPAEVLLAETSETDLLVLGTRGHGPVVSAVLGSVSEHCVQHAPCPVMVMSGTPAGSLTEQGSASVRRR